MALDHWTCVWGGASVALLQINRWRPYKNPIPRHPRYCCPSPWVRGSDDEVKISSSTEWDLPPGSYAWLFWVALLARLNRLKLLRGYAPQQAKSIGRCGLRMVETNVLIESTSLLTISSASLAEVAGSSPHNYQPLRRHQGRYWRAGMDRVRLHLAAPRQASPFWGQICLSVTIVIILNDVCTRLGWSSCYQVRWDYDKLHWFIERYTKREHTPLGAVVYLNEDDYM